MEKNNRILIIGTFPNPINGCSIANQTLLQNLYKKDYIVKTINTSVVKNISSKQGDQFSFGKAFSFFTTYHNLFVIKNVDIVYVTPGQTFFGLLKYFPFFLTCLLFRKPYIVHVHGNHLGNAYRNMDGIKKLIFAYFIKKAKAGIVLSESLRGNFRGLLPRESVFVAENFASDELYEVNLQEKKYDKLRILYLSNLMPEKGILDLLEALLLLQQLNIPFECELAGYIEETIQGKINGYLGKLSEQVKYIGIVKSDKKIEALKNANVFVLPTYYTMEGQPISILEAMATGNIIVTTRHAGIPDVVQDSNGVFIEKQNPESIASAFKQLHGQLKEMQAKGMVNRTYAAKNFTESKFTENVVSIFHEAKKNTFKQVI